MNIDLHAAQKFTPALLSWATTRQRPMPWKGESDPYRIWLSEIILQQTRVEQGWPYYLRFVETYPTVRHLADAPNDAVMKLWEGLGYYSRARNLHATAKEVAYTLGGQFPLSYAGLLTLKGIGEYTAAAIASFAYQLPHAVLDGNVYRVLARYFGIDTPTNTPAAKRAFTTLANRLLDPDRPAAFNQAMMDFGATVCTPARPLCPTCPFQQECTAYQTGRVEELPRKAKQAVRKNRFFVYAVFQHQDHTFVRQRLERDIWQNLYEFPLLEVDALPADFGELPALLLQHWFPDGAPAGLTGTVVSPPFRQTLTHRQVTAVFCEFQLPDALPADFLQAPPFAGWYRLSRAELKKNIAVPRVIDWYLQDISLTLRLEITTLLT